MDPLRDKICSSFPKVYAAQYNVAPAEEVLGRDRGGKIQNQVVGGRNIISNFGTQGDVIEHPTCPSFHS